MPTTGVLTQLTYVQYIRITFLVKSLTEKWLMYDWTDGAYVEGISLH